MKEVQCEQQQVVRVDELKWCVLAADFSGVGADGDSAPGHACGAPVVGNGRDKRDR